MEIFDGVALIESASVGGTCINYGCTPTKTLIGSAKNIFQAEHAAEYGLTVIDEVLDYQAIIRRKNRIVTAFRGELEKSLMQHPNITLLKGKGSFSKRIGLTEKAAREKGLKFTVAKMKTSSIASAIETGETARFVKAIIDNNTKTILGVAVICAGGGELMSLLQIAIAGGLTYDQLRDTMFGHPTYKQSF